MRFNEIFEAINEGIPMSTKMLNRPTKKQYTIGFEFEVAVNDDVDFEGDDIESIEDLFSDFADHFYANNTFDRKEWLEDHFRYDQSIDDFINETDDIVPIYDYVTFEDFQVLSDKEMKQKFGTDYDKVLDLLENDNSIMDLQYFEGKSKEELLQDALLIVYLDTKYIKNRSRQDDEIIDAFNTVADRDGIDAIKPILRSHYSSVERFVNLGTEPEDYENNPAFYTNEEKTEYMNVSDVNFDDLINYFNYSLDDFYEMFEEEIMNTEQEIMTSEFDEYISQRGNVDNNKLGYIRHILDEKLDIDAGSSSSTSRWAVVNDETNGVDGEIVSPVMNLQDGMKALKDIFELIDNDPYIYTNRACGLHVNVGTWNNDEIQQIDLLKFLTIANLQGVLKDFKRMSNSFTTERFESILLSMKIGDVDFDLKKYNEFVYYMNALIIDKHPKMSTVNLQKLRQHGYIELRAMGNANYEKKLDQTVFHIKKMIRSMDIAQDPNAYKNEYFKKLYQMTKPTNSKLDPLKTFTKNVTGEPYSYDSNIAGVMYADPEVLDKYFKKDTRNALISDYSNEYFGKGLIFKTKDVYLGMNDEEKEQLKKSIFGRVILKLIN